MMCRRFGSDVLNGRGDGRAHSIRMHYANVSRPSVSCQEAQTQVPSGLLHLYSANTYNI